MVIFWMFSKTKITKRVDTSREVSTLIYFVCKSFTGQQYFRIKKYCINGTSKVATASDMPNTIVTAKGKAIMKSCTIPTLVNKNGKNVMLIARVADNMLLKKCVVESTDACRLCNLNCVKAYSSLSGGCVVITYNGTTPYYWVLRF